MYCVHLLLSIHESHLRHFFPSLPEANFLHAAPHSLSLRFIIELCEPIQVKQLDIANFELFSSTPKDFLVSISDRYALQLINVIQYENISVKSSMKKKIKNI